MEGVSPEAGGEASSADIHAEVVSEKQLPKLQTPGRLTVETVYGEEDRALRHEYLDGGRRPRKGAEKEYLESRKETRALHHTAKGRECWKEVEGVSRPERCSKSVMQGLRHTQCMRGRPEPG